MKNLQTILDNLETQNRALAAVNLALKALVADALRTQNAVDAGKFQQKVIEDKVRGIGK